MKSNLYRLPIIGYSPYNDDSSEMAFVVPVFESATRKFSGELCVEHFVKAAVACGRSLVTNTNVVDLHIPIFYLLEDVVFEKWQYHFLNADIHSDRLLTFTAQDSPVKTARSSKKLYALSQDSLLVDLFSAS